MADPQPFAELAADPEIAPLLDFPPVPRKVKRPDGWTAELQRELIARLAATGTLQSAVWQMGKHATGAEALYKTPGSIADRFRKCWDAALIIGRRRNGLDSQPPFAGPVPGIDKRIDKRGGQRGPGTHAQVLAGLPGGPALPPPGMARNEHGEWEDEQSLNRRGLAAIDSINNKLLRSRRLFLRRLAGHPGKRAAFEILTELPIDWDKAAKLEAQADEPWHRCNMHQPDMILTAESGWLIGEWGYGPDRKREAQRVINEIRVEEGLEPVPWNESAERSEQT